MTFEHTGQRMAECLRLQAFGTPVPVCPACQPIRDSFGVDEPPPPDTWEFFKVHEPVRLGPLGTALDDWRRPKPKPKPKRKGPPKPQKLSCTFACVPITRRARSFIDWLGADDSPKREPNERLRRARSKLVKRAKADRKTPWHFILRAPYTGRQTALELCALLTVPIEPHRHCQTCTCFATKPKAEK